MSLIDLSDWTPDQVHEFERIFRQLKKSAGGEPLALTSEQRDIAVQLGLMPPLSVMVEVQFQGSMCRGLLHLQEDDGVYRGTVYLT